MTLKIRNFKMAARFFEDFLNFCEKSVLYKLKDTVSPKSFSKLTMNYTQTQNDPIWRPHGVFIDLLHDFRWWSKILFESLPCIRNENLVSMSFIDLVVNCLEIPKWSYLETPWGIYWPSAWFSMMIKDLIQITALHQKCLLVLKP